MATTTKPEHWMLRTLRFIFTSPMSIIGTFALIILLLSMYNTAFAKEFFLWLIIVGGSILAVTSGLILWGHHMVSHNRAKSGAPGPAMTGLQWIDIVWSRVFHNSITTLVACIALIGLMDYFHPMIGLQANIALDNIFEHLFKPLLVFSLCLGLMFYGFKVMLGAHKHKKK
jgi:hypothetical protein